MTRSRLRKGALLLLLAASSSGCSLFTTLLGPPAGFLRREERPRSATGLQEFRGVVHCHSFRSHDSDGTIEEIGAAADATGMDFLVMTDHPAPYSVLRGKRGMVGDTLFLVGAEIRVPGGTLLAFPLKHYVRPQKTLQGYIDEIHRQGGLAVVGHAERFRRWDASGIDGVEVHNLHAAANAAPKPLAVFKALFTPLGTLFMSLARPNREVLRNWDGMERFPVPAIGGNDAHANINVLGPLGWTLGNYHEVFRVLSTHVLAERRDPAAIVAAMKAGRTFVSFDLWRDGSGFGFWAEDGGRSYEMGATVTTAAHLRVRVPAPAKIRVLRGGVVVGEGCGRTFAMPVPAPGIYRVEAYLDGELWILSSGIRVAAGG